MAHFLKEEEEEHIRSVTRYVVKAMPSYETDTTVIRFFPRPYRDIFLRRAKTTRKLLESVYQYVKYPRPTTDAICTALFGKRFDRYKIRRLLYCILISLYDAHNWDIREPQPWHTIVDEQGSLHEKQNPDRMTIYLSSDPIEQHGNRCNALAFMTERTMVFSYEQMDYTFDQYHLPGMRPKRGVKNICCIEDTMIHELAHVELQADDVLLLNKFLPDTFDERERKLGWDSATRNGYIWCQGLYKCMVLASTPVLSDKAYFNADTLSKFCVLINILIHCPGLDFVPNPSISRQAREVATVPRGTVAVR